MEKRNAAAAMCDCGMPGCDCRDGSCNCGIGGGGHGGHRRMHWKAPFIILALVMLSVWLGFKARNEARQFDYIGVPLERNVISVSGTGKMVVKPDIAEIDLGTSIERRTVKEAQDENTRVMNQINAKLKEAGIEEKDLQTSSYNIFPNYDWANNKQTLRSYTVAQNTHVKIRDTGKVGDIIGMAGGLGANQVGGISFAVDEPEKVRSQAREKAIADAKQKAGDIARAAGLSLEKIVSFSESTGGYPPPMYYAKDAMLAEAQAGAANTAPSVESGSSEYRVDVTISYQIR